MNTNNLCNLKVHSVAIIYISIIGAIMFLSAGLVTLLGGMGV